MNCTLEHAYHTIMMLVSDPFVLMSVAAGVKPRPGTDNYDLVPVRNSD